MANVYLGLGTNLGDRKRNLQAMWEGLNALPKTRLLRRSAVYRTAPVGGPAGQGEFYNCVCVVWTEMAPRDLLVAVHGLERSIGRLREKETVVWGPRVADVDILLWDDLILAEPDLLIPHPRLAIRAFVLIPLAELVPDMVHPTAGLTIRELLQSTEAQHAGIQRLSF